MKSVRYFVGGALVVGVALGVWLADFFKGIGTGNGVGIGQSGFSSITASLENGGVRTEDVDLGVSADSVPTAVPDSLKVVIKDRALYLRSETGDSPIDVLALVGMVKSAKGDGDGIKLRIYRTESARVTAEVDLRKALSEASVAESAIYTSPDMVE